MCCAGLRELEKEGVLGVQNRRGHAYYRLKEKPSRSSSKTMKLPKCKDINKLVSEERAVFPLRKTVHDQISTIGAAFFAMILE
jgi:phage FluMu protein Com